MINARSTNIKRRLYTIASACLALATSTCDLGVKERICQTSSDCTSHHHCERAGDGSFRCVLDAPVDTPVTVPDGGSNDDGGNNGDGSTPPTDGGTDGGTPMDGGISVSFAQMVQPSFDTWCTICHDALAPAAGLNLADHAYEHLVNVPTTCSSSISRVAPGDPENSMLWRKLAGASDRCGGAMPLGGPGLRITQPEAFNLIETWIREGAANN